MSDGFVRPRVYLAGPITGKNYSGAVSWRAMARNLLGPDIETLSPMRGKAYLNRELCISGAPDAYQRVSVLSASKGICTRDRWDTQRADVVLMYLVGADRVSIGTMIEIGWADSARRPIVLVMEPGNVHEHAMVNHLCGFIVPTLEEGVAIVRQLVQA